MSARLNFLKKQESFFRDESSKIFTDFVNQPDRSQKAQSSLLNRNEYLRTKLQELKKQIEALELQEAVPEEAKPTGKLIKFNFK